MVISVCLVILGQQATVADVVVTGLHPDGGRPRRGNDVHGTGRYFHDGLDHWDLWPTKNINGSFSSQINIR